MDNLFKPIYDALREHNLESEDTPVIWYAESLSSISEASSSVHNADLLLYCPPHSDSEQVKRHPGVFFEVFKLSHHDIIHVYALHEEGRRCQRKLVYSSDGRMSLVQRIRGHRERKIYWDLNERFGEGDFFGGDRNNYSGVQTLESLTGTVTLERLVCKSHIL